MTSAADRARAALGDLAELGVPLGELTTYRVGGRAALLARARSSADLEAVSRAVISSGLPVLVIGRGSNLLVADRGFDGIAVLLSGSFEEVRIETTVVTAGGAVSLPILARRTAAAGLTGMEWAVGIPGSVGGAVRMNAGGHGADIASTLDLAEVFDLRTGAVRHVDADDLDLGYRHSSVGPNQVVTWARFVLRYGDRATSEAEIAEIVRWRRENQPGGQNAGSVFSNPPGDAAGRLIELAGLKGFRHRTAQVSEKHANFIQADPDGSADDVFALVREVRRRVLEETGVLLEPELRLVGFPDLDVVDEKMVRHEKGER